MIRLRQVHTKFFRADTRRRKYAVLLIPAAVLLLSMVSCFAPLSQEEAESGLALDVQMSSKASGGESKVLAGLLIHSGFEETLKDVTQLMVATESGLISDQVSDEMDDELEELLMDVALGGTVKFSGNPYFAVKVSYDSANQEADFSISGVPSGKSYCLYMGGFDTMDDVKQFFGLMEESDDFDDDDIPYSHLFYVDGQESNGVVEVSFDVPGFASGSVPANFVVNTNGNYSGSGWYYVEEWEHENDQGIPMAPTTTIHAAAEQPIEVKTGKEASITVYLSADS